MRLSSLVIALVFLFPVTARAQATPAPPSSVAIEGITLGEPMQLVRDTLGDPVQLSAFEGQQIWRYLAGNGALFVDVWVKNNVAYSVTVLGRFKNSPYTDDAGIAFGSSSGDVRTKLGEPKKTTTNADDRSVDLWYTTDDWARIYEFYGDKLGFVQILPSPKLQATFQSPPAVSPADGSSLASAIRIRPANLLGNSAWIDAYLAMNHCDTKGHWKLLSSKMSGDDATGDIMAYFTVHAQCTDGGAERDFIFDTHGTLTKNGANGSPSTIYIDASQMHGSAVPAASPPAAPVASPAASTAPATPPSVRI
jgi:hypothetical protein